MTTLNLDQNILSAGAGVSAGEWASAAADVSLDFRAGAALKRGLDLEAGIGIMGEIDAAFRYFVAADVEVAAQASARLRGQIQAPLDLFEEAGMAIRLQAVAEASISGRLSIGLSIGEFLELAQQDERIDELAYALLVIFLEELDIQAGVMGKAAFAAKAQVNVVLVGRMLPDSILGLKPGFTISVEAGVGLKGGAGYQVFANLGFKDTRRLVSRTIDLLVDETITQLSDELDDDYARSLVAQLRVPAKIGLRTAFEVGFATYEAAPSFAANGNELARQCARVALEECQKALLEIMIQLATDQFMEALATQGIDEADWESTKPQRDAFASLLRSLPREPFEPTSQNAAYWVSLANSAVTLGIALGGAATDSEEWIEPAAIIWSAAQLMTSAVQQIVNADARASFFGAVSVSTQVSAFSGALPDNAQVPQQVQEYINAALDRNEQAAIDQDVLVDFLVRDVLLQRLLQEYPEAETLVELLAGADAGGAVATLQVIMRNINAFVPASDGSGFDSKASLTVVADGLEAYIDHRFENELQLILHEQLGTNPIMTLYVDEVIYPSLQFSAKTVIRRALDWGTGDLGSRAAIREACSSIVMKVLGRSAVVTADVLVAASLAQMSTSMHAFADEVADPDGPARDLATATDTDPEIVAEIIEESVRIAADVFGPQPEEVRAKMRSLMYDLLDTVPNPPNDDWVEQLQQDLFIPNERSRDAIYELADIAGTQLTVAMLRFLENVLARIAQLVLEWIEELAIALAAQIMEWAGSMAALAAELLQRLLDLPGEILQLVQRLADLTDQALAEVETALSVFGTSSGRNRLISNLRDRFANVSLIPLKASSLYMALDEDLREQAEARMRLAINEIINQAWISPILQAMTPVASAGEEIVAEIRDVLQELQQLNPNANVAAQVRTMLLDRLEDAVRASWGNENPGIDLAFTFEYSVTPPAVPTWNFTTGEWDVYQAPTQHFSIEFDLGRIEIPLNTMITQLRAAAASLTQFENAVSGIVEHLVEWLEAQAERLAAETELELVDAQQQEVQQLLTDASSPPGDVDILAPLPGTLCESSLPVDILIGNVSELALGTGGLGPQRVFIYMNNDAVDLSGFEVTTVADTGSVDRDSSDSDTGNSRHPSNLRPVIIDTSNLHRRPGRFTYRESILSPNLANRGEVTSPRRDDNGHSISTRKFPEQFRARVHGAGSATVTRRRGDVVRRRGDKAPVNRLDRSLDTTYLYANGGKELLPARPLSKREKSEILKKSGPGLRLTRTFTRAELREGINTLTITAIGSDGTSTSASVVFLAAATSDQGDDPQLSVGGLETGFVDLAPEVVKVLRLTSPEMFKHIDFGGLDERPTGVPDGPTRKGATFWFEESKTARARRIKTEIRNRTSQLQATTTLARDMRGAVRGQRLRPITRRIDYGRTPVRERDPRRVVGT